MLKLKIGQPFLSEIHIVFRLKPCWKGVEINVSASGLNGFYILC